ncbi:hypothetical protein CKF58_02235 [Psittacicella hinzii]|uniref:Sel1 repeat family protein n=2 Tax=Psittacicella hinzii TaxID=2028575 RepID=A0A3A1YPF0_9GAMM|nr:hypothetical protein CKF58_02235 [Psittacicella hinzii]
MNRKAQNQGNDNDEQFAYPPDVIDLYNRGYNYETGYGATGIKSIDKAVEFYQLAADKDYPAAYYRLAMIYARGKENFEANLELAQKFAAKAAAHAYPGAEEIYQYVREQQEIAAQSKKLP